MSKRVRIYSLPRNAMQSGAARAGQWVLEFEQASPRRPDPLMGWIGSDDTQAQVRLNFASREEALAYAEAQGLEAEVELPRPHRVPPKAYADNFRFGRRENWTH
jgi:hypothetical protein